MWLQNYTPIGGSLALSSLVAAIPIFVLLYLLGIARKPSWIASLCGLVSALAVALFAYGMPVSLAVSSAFYGAANGMLPIGWIVFTAILLYRVTVETGKFEIIKDSVASLTGDQRLLALLVAFSFGGFIEGAAGFGTPVAVAGAMLAGLGFTPFFAAAICLVANTAPVAFGSIGAPQVMLQNVTKLPMAALSADVGRLCSPFALIIPAYIMLIMGGTKALKEVLPAALLSGLAFAGTEFAVSNFVGPELVAILGAIVSLVVLVLLLKVWKPANTVPAVTHPHTGGEVLLAWSPYLLLVMFVLAWATPSIKKVLDDAATFAFGWPGLHNLVHQVVPVAAKETPYAAGYRLTLLSASGTSCLFAVFASCLVLGVSPGRLAKYIAMTGKQLMFPLITIASVVGLAYVMNYSGATATLGLMIAGTGVLFPFFSPLLGWLGVFLTGSDTSANALFGTLQTVTATKLMMSPTLMAAANSSGGVMGKMISLQSIAVAAAATGMKREEEGKLFRFTLKHSVFLAFLMGLLVMFYAYVMPNWVK